MLNVLSPDKPPLRYAPGQHEANSDGLAFVSNFTTKSYSVNHGHNTVTIMSIV